MPNIMTCLKALIIDDNENDRALALREVKKLFPQFKYWEIIDEADFSKALQQQKFNLVITDYRLRWTTGLDILYRLKEQIPDCPVIMFTGTGSEEIAVEAMKAGLDDYVIKSPKHYIRLAAAVRSAWQRAQQKQALDAIQQSYDRFFERVPLGLYRLDPSGTILEANSTLIKTLGGSRIKDLLGQNLTDYHLDRAAYLQWQQQLTQADAVENWEGQIRTLDNRSIWVSHKAIAVKDRDGEIIYYEGAVADITASKQAQLERIELLARERRAKEEAERLNRIKDEFLATLSHELRTPLNAVIGWSQLIRAGKLSKSQSAKAIETIYRNARAQNQLIEDLLDVSRIIRGTMNLNLQSGNLIEVLRSSLDTVRPTAAAKQIEIETQFLDPIKVNLDPERLQQVFWNLLINAVKFTPVGGLVTVETITSQDTVAIRITDTGQGIAADTLPYVFDRFSQAETKSSTRTQGGLGLGLAIVRHLVEIHGGRVMADSDGLGQGATFTVELPLLSEPPNNLQNLAPTPTTNALPSLAGLTLLVVEDEADAREMIILILEQCGAKVIAADSVKQAWSKYQQHQLDAVISDISMPLEDGYELIRQIRNSETTRQISAIALTAYAREEDKQKALKAGFDLHLPKPIEPFELVKSLAQLISVEPIADN
ncbi:response regulator [Pleurocapsa sp. PCC 7319]|uniref:hybrid sensor histidine kinase/response regulator n=1 Tax=Pleurocapsa sp. PCC 7319 TaxID=118161 RepID=UPI00034D1A69|nr:response regulator [Pleurocapsa sp. PCC 7319]